MAFNACNKYQSLERVPNIDDTVSKLYTGLSALQQQSKNFQKRDIEQLLKAALGCADSTLKYTPSSDTSSFLHSDDSNDSSRLLIASESDQQGRESVSRAKTKMAEIMMEKEASELNTANTSIKQMIASQLAYANELCKLLDMPAVELNTFKRVGQDIVK